MNFNGILSGLGQAAQQFFYKPPQTGQATQQQSNRTMPNNIKSPVPITPMTNRLNPGIKSPLASNQVASHPIQPSGFEQAIRGVQGFGQNIAKAFNPAPEMIPGKFANTPLPTRAPTPSSLPGQNEWVALQMKGNPSKGAAYYTNMYRDAVTAPGGHYYQPPGARPTITPMPTARPQQSAFGQVMNAQASPQPQGSLSQASIAFLEQNVFPTTDKMGIPRALAASQWAVEGGRTTQSPINNFFGIGPGWKFNNVHDNVQTYGNTVVSILRAKGYNPAQMSPVQIIQALQQGERPRYEGHNPDPQTYVGTVTGTPEWRYYSQ